ncbi:MAG: hypothetical protein ACYC6T_08510 [Thermoleophilia bacterium]
MTGFRNIFRGPESLEGGLVLDEARLDEALGDPVLAALADELATLGDVQVPASARQRGLALVRAEVELQDRRGLLGPARGTGLLFRGRLALGSVVVVLAAFLGLVGLYGGGDSSQWTGSGGTGGSGTGPVTSGTSRPDTGSTLTSVPDSDTTATSVVGTTVPGATSIPTITATTSVAGTGTTAMSPPSTTATTTRPSSSTTATSQPGGSTSTTGRAVLTREQREGSARSVAMSLSEKVVLNDPEGAAAMLAGSAGAGFVQLVSSLEAPYGNSVISVATTDGPNTRVLVEFLDRVTTVQGTNETTLRFYYEMRVDDSGALVTAIYKAPAR